MLQDTRQRATRRTPAALPLSEHAMQVAVVTWARLQETALPALRLLHAVPNGGPRSIGAARKLKAEGVKAGVPDLVLPVPAAGFAGLYVEMKTKDGRVTPDQAEWHVALQAAGHRVEVCRSIESAIEVLREHAQAAL